MGRPRFLDHECRSYPSEKYEFIIGVFFFWYVTMSNTTFKKLFLISPARCPPTRTSKEAKPSVCLVLTTMKMQLPCHHPKINFTKATRVLIEAFASLMISPWYWVNGGIFPLAYVKTVMLNNISCFYILIAYIFSHSKWICSGFIDTVTISSWHKTPSQSFLKKNLRKGHQWFLQS